MHLDSLDQTALRLTHNRAEAEDVVQETCLRAFRNFHRFTAGTNCRAWLFRILRNVFLNRIRDGSREVLDPQGAPAEGESAALTSPMIDVESPEEHLLQSVVHGDVDRALRALPLAFREPVVLADLEGFSYREIAEILECPIGTVMSRLFRGRRLLRQSLAAFAREHGYAKETG